MQARLSKGENDASMGDYEFPPAPLEYVVMKWRQRMSASYTEAVNLPYEVIIKDLQMLDIEAEFSPKRAIM